MFSLSAETTVRDAAAESRLLRYSRVLVYDRTPDDVVGIVHRVDVLRAAADDQFDVKVGELMHPAYFVVESARLDRLLRTFLERRQHMVAVIDEFGSLDGIVTLEDVLEEILGLEIVDETDQVTDLRVLARRRREETLGRTGSPPIRASVTAPTRPRIPAVPERLGLGGSPPPSRLETPRRGCGRTADRRRSGRSRSRRGHGATPQGRLLPSGASRK